MNSKQLVKRLKGQQRPLRVGLAVDTGPDSIEFWELEDADIAPCVIETDRPGNFEKVFYLSRLQLRPAFGGAAMDIDYKDLDIIPPVAEIGQTSDTQILERINDRYEFGEELSDLSDTAKLDICLDEILWDINQLMILKKDVKELKERLSKRKVVNK